MISSSGQALLREAQPLTNSEDDYDGLLDLIGDAAVVLLGEATHGTHEFYREHARITRRLIEERGFQAVAVEADWLDAYRVNRYLHGAGDDADAEQALRGFRRFPSWLWRNAEMLDFVGWLCAHNERAGFDRGTGFFGLDLYSLYASVAETIAYLEQVNPPAAERARRRYARFEPCGHEQAYGRDAGIGLSEPCRAEAIARLTELQLLGDSHLRGDGIAAEDERFHAEQNARLVAHAGKYYRSMFEDPTAFWNRRDRHMADTLGHLLDHLGRHGKRPRLVVWEHNSHVGDARVTEMCRLGELNLGQLARERWPEDVALVGFTTYGGTVTAASAWDAPAERKRMRPALEESYEALFHDLGHPRFLLDLASGPIAQALVEPRLERAIGITYHPETERNSHYLFAHMAVQFDALVHIDETRAVEPLERTAGWEVVEPPQTYPSAL